MTLMDALTDLLLLLFDRNELRTLASTDLYLGDLAADLPPPDASAEDTTAAVVAAMLRRGLAGRSLFRTLASLRPAQGRVIRGLDALWSSRRVAVLFDGTAPTPDATVARALAAALADRGHRTWSVPPAAGQEGSWVERDVHSTCDAVLLVLSASAIRSPPLRAAVRSALARRRAGSSVPLLMVAAMDATLPDGDLLPFMAGASLYMADGPIDALGSSLDADLRRMPTDVAQPVELDRTPWGRPRLAPLPDPRPPGPVPVAEAFARGLRPADASFAMEILAWPPRVEAVETRLKVTVDRAGVTEGIHTGAARNALWATWLGTRERREAAAAWDAWYQAVLTGGDPGPAPKEPPVPLRWAAGGVLPLAWWRGRTWVPLFFRDIPPYGWVLPLGATDADDDLQDPGAFAVREALEELVVLRGEPRRDRPVVLRPVLVDDGEGPEVALERSRAALLAPLALRLERDGLVVAGDARHDAIPADPVATRTDLVVRGPDGASRLHRNVLVSVGPLDLGIDVVRVLRIDLGENDTILDGEILVRPDGSRDLVRMPVAMVAWTAIARIFSRRAVRALSWTGDTPPSVRAGPLKPGDLHVFPWDVVRRREIALGTRIGAESDPRDRARCRTWLEQFGPCFLDAEGAPSSASPSDLWVPATARVLAQAVARGVGP